MLTACHVVFAQNAIEPDVRKSENLYYTPRPAEYGGGIFATPYEAWAVFAASVSTRCDPKAPQFWVVVQFDSGKVTVSAINTMSSIVH